MTLTLIRTKFLSDRTIGALHIDDVLFCDTLEPSRSRQMYGLIPDGTYGITLKVQSPKYLQVATYRKINARMPRLLKVPGREGILIHPGNRPEDTRGCILVGKLNINDNLQESRNTFFELYRRMQQAEQKGESINIFVI